MIVILCMRCEQALEEPGAIIISPPVTTARKPQAKTRMVVDKFHICVKCWPGLAQWLHKIA